MNTTTNTPATRNYPLGLPLLAIIGLAFLAAPRVVLHDLHIIEEGSFVNALFVFVPLIIWIAVVVAKRVPKPFLTLLAVGVFYGIFLGTGHLLFWEQAFPAGAPQLGGNLADISPMMQSIMMKTFTALSSLVTGTLVGAVCGLIATGLSKLIHRSPTPEKISR